MSAALNLLAQAEAAWASADWSNAGERLAALHRARDLVAFLERTK